MSHYRNLRAWQAAHALALATYRVTATWPATERYGLVSQVRRAAASAATNLVEGSVRRGRKEFRHFAGISLASIAEVEYLVTLAVDVGVARDADHDALAPLVASAGRLCYRLVRSLGGAAD